MADVDNRTQSIANVGALIITIIGSIVMTVLYYTGEQREFTMKVQGVEIELKHQAKQIIELQEKAEIIMKLFGDVEACNVKTLYSEKKINELCDQVNKNTKILTEGVSGLRGY